MRLNSLLIYPLFLGLMGCGSASNISMPSLSMPSFGGGSGEAAPPIKSLTSEEIDCPEVQILEGAASMRFGPAGGGAASVAHQASITDLARECKVSGRSFTMNVGIEGRVLTGTLGKPGGTYTVPVRVAVKRGSSVIYSRLTRVSVTVPAGDTQGKFSHVETGILLNISERNPAEEYDVLVGFDPQGRAIGDDAVAKSKRSKRR